MRSFLVLFLTLNHASISAQTLNTQSAKIQPPNIILITLDTTRADRMGFLGSKRGLTPNLDALAGKSVVFTRAYAQVPLTTPSHAALLTGTYPQFNYLKDLGDPLGEDLPYLPDLLHQHGYKTAAFVGSMVLDPGSAAPGFDRGFDVYDADFHHAAAGEDRYHSLERRAEDVATRSMGWLSHNNDGPFFLWIHFYDPHDPYDPPEPFKTQYASAPYDGEIAYMDSVIGSLTDVLTRHGLFENTLIAIAADHGESLGEHGEMRHGLLLYDETIRVPLFLKLPGEKFAGKRIAARVAVADITPSLLQAADISIPTGVQAQSLFPMIDSSTVEEKSKSSERGIYSETDYAHRSFGWAELRSWRAGKYLYVQAPEKELYDQAMDPGALKNLAPSAHAIANTLDAQLVEFLRKTSRSEIAGQSKLGPEQADSLRALGYLATEVGSSKPSEAVLVNPKDKVKVASQLQEALSDLQEDRYDKALAEFKQVAQDPDISQAYLEFGIAMARRQRYQDALPILRTAVTKMPDSAVAHFEFAKVLGGTGQWEDALAEMRMALTLKPDSGQLHFFMAAVYGHLKRIPDAIAEYEKTLNIDPSSFDANFTYGRLLLQLGQSEKALPRLRLATQSKPESLPAHWYLADAYQQLGQTENADKERAKAGNFRPAPGK